MDRRKTAEKFTLTSVDLFQIAYSNLKEGVNVCTALHTSTYEDESCICLLVAICMVLSILRGLITILNEHHSVYCTVNATASLSKLF